MSVLLFSEKPNRGEILETRRIYSHTSYKHYITMNKRPKLLHLTIRVDVKKKVKVRAYERIRNGLIQKVRSHYRTI